MVVNLFTADFEKLKLTDLEDALAINLPIAQRPAEGTKIDYKLKEPDDFADTVAAFANTAGGLLFIGVQDRQTKEKLNVPIALPGEMFPGGDVKAHLTAKLLSQITPRPDFDVGVVPLPAATNPHIPQGSIRAVVVIRVREGIWPPYESSNGNHIRQPIRIQDSTRQATLRDLEQLFSRRQLSSQNVEQQLQAFDVHPRNPSFVVIEDGTKQQTVASHAYQTWLIRPRASLRVRLDRAFDAQLHQFFRSNFPSTNIGQFWPPIMTSSSHMLRWQAQITGDHDPLTCVTWLECTSEGAIRLCEKVDRHQTKPETISDLFIRSAQLWRLIKSLYSALEYYGGVTIMHRLDCQEEIEFVSTFPDPYGKGYALTDAIKFPSIEKGRARGSSCIVREAEGYEVDDPINLICEIMLGHLRQLCQAQVDFPELRSLMAAMPADVLGIAL